MSGTRRRRAVGGALFALMLGSVVPTAGGAAGDDEDRDHRQLPRIELTWTDCGTTDEAVAAGVECAVADLPMDYDEPKGDQVHIAVARVPARDPEHRIGSVFVNPGGPGTPIVSLVQAAGGNFAPNVNQRFDIVGFDPRGVGQSTPAVDCHVDQETEGATPRPWPVPTDLDPAAVVAHAQRYVDACLATNGAILEHLSTANVARDMDVLRAAVGDEKLTYVGYSYGTFLGSTYASLFPDRFRALVLDSPVPARQYIHDPATRSIASAGAVEDSLDRFLTACAADQVACSGFGGSDPFAAFDALIAAAAEAPIPAEGYAPDPRPVTAEDIRDVTGKTLFDKEQWGLLAAALASAAAGDATIVRALADETVFGRGEDGSFDPGPDQTVAIFAAEQQWPTEVDGYLARGAGEFVGFPHFWGRFAYSEIPFAFWPAHDDDAFGGPFAVAPSAPTVLLIATTHDTATPYAGALALAQELGNVRLLTMDGDGHTAAYQGNSACIDAAADAYLLEGTLPAEGTVCRQEVPFAPFVPGEALAGAR